MSARDERDALCRALIARADDYLPLRVPAPVHETEADAVAVLLHEVYALRAEKEAVRKAKYGWVYALDLVVKEEAHVEAVARLRELEGVDDAK